MKISELIDTLQKILNQHGDIDVEVFDDFDYSSVESVSVHTYNINDPFEFKTVQLDPMS